MEAENELDTAKATYPLNTQLIVDAKVKLQRHQAGLLALKELQQELF